MTQIEYGEFVNKVKETIANQPIPPNYNRDEWNGKGVNCYLYAMRACMNFEDKEDLTRPGFLARREKKSFVYKKDFVIKNFKADCKALGLKVFPTELEEPIRENEYKIAVYVNENRDFHFRRQDRNGEWSEQSGWYGIISTIKSKYITKNDGDYIFCGIFKVVSKK